MIDLSWLTTEAHRIHDYFNSIFYVVVGLLLVIGISLEYFKMYLGSMPAFQLLLVRSLIAVILLVSYPEISNTVAAVADLASEALGNFRSMHGVLEKTGELIHKKSISWTSPGDWFVLAISYLVYFFLYISIFFYDVGIAFCLTLLYVFSPLLIALYVLPQTASACSGLFKSLFEIAAWKINFSVLASLLWNACLKAFDQTAPDGSNYIFQLAVILLLAISVLCTPLIVNMLLAGGITGAVTKFTGLAMAGATYGMLSPDKIANAPFVPPKKLAEKSYNQGVKPAFKGASNFTDKKLVKPIVRKTKSYSKNLYRELRGESDPSKKS